MTTEEKAKAYDEAMNKIKPLYEQAKIDGNPIWSTYEYLIPQLRESEDERNANALIRLLNDDKITSLITYEARQQWLDWLERKKIPSVSFNPALGFDPGSAVVYHNEESEDERIRKLLVWQVYRNIEDETNDLAQSVYDGIKGHDPDLEESIEDWKKCLAYLEKQKEQKPAEVKDPFSNANFVRGYESGYADAKREQKPAQTDDEKGYIRTTKSIIADFVRDKQPEDVTFYQKIYDWLDGRHIEQKSAEWDELQAEFRSINKAFEDGKKEVIANPKKYGLCKPAEWSEEDEKTINNIVSVLGKYIDYKAVSGTGSGYATPRYAKEIDWLKSLRPDSYKNCNSQWKPSEEQMKALEECGECKRCIKELCNDLKKRM